MEGREVGCMGGSVMALLLGVASYCKTILVLDSV